MPERPEVKRSLVQVYLEPYPLVRVPTHRWPLRSRLLAAVSFLIGADITIKRPIIYEEKNNVFRHK